ncbi:MAG: DUF6855 family protein [Methylobacter sp.]
MTISLNSPSDAHLVTFEFEVSANNEIIIMHANQNKTRYCFNAIRDLYLWLLSEQKNDGWVLLGTKGQEDEPIEGSVEAWARNPENPIGGFYGLDNGRKGRFATFIPPILEYMGLAEVEHNNPQGNRMRARPLFPLNAAITTR